MTEISSRKSSGHTLIELVVVMLLIAILSGMSFLGILRSINLYSTTTRDYLGLFQEGKIALEKIVREIRECSPEDISIGTDSIGILKKAGHATVADGSLVVDFVKNGDRLQRVSSAGTFTLAENISLFNASQDGTTLVVTVDLTLARGGNTVRLRTATLPRQNPSPP